MNLKEHISCYNLPVISFNLFTVVLIALFSLANFVMAQTSNDSILSNSIAINSNEKLPSKPLITNFEKLVITGDAVVTVGGKVYYASSKKVVSPTKTKKKPDKNQKIAKIEKTIQTEKSPDESQKSHLRQSPLSSNFFYVLATSSAAVSTVSETFRVQQFSKSTLKSMFLAFYPNNYSQKEIVSFFRHFILPKTEKPPLWSRPPPLF